MKKAQDGYGAWCADLMEKIVGLAEGHTLTVDSPGYDYGNSAKAIAKKARANNPARRFVVSHDFTGEWSREEMQYHNYKGSVCVWRDGDVGTYPPASWVTTGVPSRFNRQCEHQKAHRWLTDEQGDPEIVSGCSVKAKHYCNGIYLCDLHHPLSALEKEAKEIDRTVDWLKALGFKVSS